MHNYGAKGEDGHTRKRVELMGRIRVSGGGGVGAVIWSAQFATNGFIQGRLEKVIKLGRQQRA